MKQSLPKNKLSKIPKSKKSKINFELSLKAKNRFSKLKYDSINKETLDGSCIDTVFFNPDRLNNSKTSFGKNNSLGKIDNNKLLVFTSSLKYPFYSRKSLQNCSKGKFSKKTLDLSEENTSNVEKVDNSEFPILKASVKYLKSYKLLINLYNSLFIGIILFSCSLVSNFSSEI